MLLTPRVRNFMQIPDIRSCEFRPCHSDGVVLRSQMRHDETNCPTAHLLYRCVPRGPSQNSLLWRKSGRPILTIPFFEHIMSAPLQSLPLDASSLSQERPVGYRIVSLTAIGSVMSCLAVALAMQRVIAQNDTAETIRRMLMVLHENEEFTGSVLVAQAGKIIYRDAIASTPDEARKLLTSPSNIGSLAKGFTAMAAMMLADRGRLSYDDPIARYVPELAGATSGITLRHLLTHTSGIPDVGDLGIDRPGLRERDVVNAVRAHHASFARPGLKYRYSNTGYIIVAMAVESITGETFDRFLQTAIFEPLDMTSTRPAAGPRGPDLTKGDGGLVSTADDLLKWDQALASERLVSAKTFSEALVPAKVDEGQSTYGFGWNVGQRDGDTYMWHTGNAGGQRAFIGRRLHDRLAIIILTEGNSRRVEIADAIVNIVHNRPYDPPKLSITPRLLAVIDAQGVDAALTLYAQLRAADRRYDFSEAELNSLGYTLLDKGRNADAVRVFELNARQFPTSSNAFDSLGDGLSRSGRRTEATQAYSRALDLDPSNVNARAKLRKVESRTWQLATATGVFIVAAFGAWFLFSRRGRNAVSRPSRDERR
jgi:CubicO group peptidase (beta-lactamase class C family)